MSKAANDDDLGSLRMMDRVDVDSLPESDRIEYQDTGFAEVISGKQVTYKPLNHGRDGEPKILSGREYLTPSMMRKYLEIVGVLEETIQTYNQRCLDGYEADYVVGNIQSHDSKDGDKIVITRIRTNEW